MTEQIGEETQLLLVCTYAGLILGLSYDFIRVGRLVKKASVFRSILEDVVFWTVASIYLFHIFLKYNYGQPRFYGVMTTACSMVLFEWLWGRHMVPKTAGIIIRISGILGKPLKKIKNAFTLLFRKHKCHANEEKG